VWAWPAKYGFNIPAHSTIPLRTEATAGQVRLRDGYGETSVMSLPAIGLGSSKSANAKLHTWMQANGKPDRADASKKQKNHAKKKNRTKACPLPRKRCVGGNALAGKKVDAVAR